MRKSKRRLGVLAIVLSASVVIGACGDDDDDDDASGNGSAAPRPTGAPIEIGFSNTENSPVGSYTDVRLGAQAAVEHVNNDLGGVNGRPISMENCITNASAESSIACANKFVQERKVAVSYGLDYGSAGSWSVYEKAAIPVVGGIASDATQLASPNSYLFVGGVASAVPATARYAAENLKAKNVAVLAPDIPAARAAVDNFVTPVLTKYGVTQTQAVYESPTAPDYAPAMTKVKETNPDVVIILGGGGECSKMMQATAAAGIDPKTVIHVFTCTSPEFLEAGGAGAEGITAQVPFLPPESDDPQVQEWRAAMKKYEPDAVLSPQAQSGFNSIMNLAAIMKKIPGDVTPQSIVSALKATNNEPNFMAHPYTCDGNQFPSLVAICNTNERFVTITGGEFTEVSDQWIDGVAGLRP